MNELIEKLKAYRDELLNKKQTIIETNNIEAIDVEVAAYRETLLKADAIAREEAIKKVDSDINCIDILIAREEEAVAAAAVPVTEEIITNA